jgi:20S proteasome alpha/beta subunit
MVYISPSDTNKSIGGGGTIVGIKEGKFVLLITEPRAL